ncbi:unnamed protein product, partial [Dibothriocephalus latus]
MPAHKRPLGLPERQALDDFVARLCIRLARLLEVVYEAGYHLAGPTRPPAEGASPENYCLVRHRLLHHMTELVDQPFCLTAVPSNVLRTDGGSGEDRSVIMRLERITTLLHQNPTDIRF